MEKVKLYSSGTAATGGGLKSIVILENDPERRYNLVGYRVCGARNSKNMFCGRLGRCPFHSSRVDQKDKENGGESGLDDVGEQLVDGVLEKALLGGTATLVVAKSTECAEQTLKGQEALAYLDSERDVKTSDMHARRFKRSWSLEEHALFLEALAQHGRGKWKKVAECIGTRTAVQCQSHAQKFFGRTSSQQQVPFPWNNASADGRQGAHPTTRKRSIHDMRVIDEVQAESQKRLERQMRKKERESRQKAAIERREQERAAALEERMLQERAARRAVADSVKPLSQRKIAEVLLSVRKSSSGFLKKAIMDARIDPSKPEDDDDHVWVPVPFQIPVAALPPNVMIHYLRNPYVIRGSTQSTSE